MRRHRRRCHRACRRIDRERHLGDRVASPSQVLRPSRSRARESRPAESVWERLQRLRIWPPRLRCRRRIPRNRRLAIGRLRSRCSPRSCRSCPPRAGSLPSCLSWRPMDRGSPRRRLTAQAMTSCCLSPTDRSSAARRNRTSRLRGHWAGSDRARWQWGGRAVPVAEAGPAGAAGPAAVGWGPAPVAAAVGAARSAPGPAAALDRQRTQRPRSRRTPARSRPARCRLRAPRKRTSRSRTLGQTDACAA
jgi:hypothetical protein